MDTVIDDLTEARTAWRRGDWRGSRAAYVRVDGVGSMALDDLDAFAAATWRSGDVGEAVRLAERVYDRLARTDPAAAARKAADVALAWHVRGHDVVARTWIDRARLLQTRDGAVVGYLAYLDAAAALARNTSADRAALARSAEVLRATAADSTLAVLRDVVVGLAALVEARAADGVRLLDAVLLPVIDERVPLEWAGDVYRTVLGPGARFADDDHLASWRRSLRAWCDDRALTVDAVLRAPR